MAFWCVLSKIRDDSLFYLLGSSFRIVKHSNFTAERLKNDKEEKSAYSLAIACMLIGVE